jgi:hypothetical protein
VEIDTRQTDLRDGITGALFQAPIGAAHGKSVR